MKQGDQKTSKAEKSAIQLSYYDGLARQEDLITLTVDMRLGMGSDQRGGEDHDMVPPLEFCIRTKWREAAINWNGSEKIL